MKSKILIAKYFKHFMTKMRWVFLLFIGFPLLMFLIKITINILSLDDSHKPIDGKELIPTKCKFEYYLKKNVEIYQNKEKVGTTIFPVYVCFHNTDKQDSITIYGWIWSQSIKVELDSTLSLIANENLRIASNQRIIAILLQGTKGKLIYNNVARSWTLAAFKVSTDSKSLTNKKSIFRFEDPEKTNTTSIGGDIPDDRSMERF